MSFDKGAKTENDFREKVMNNEMEQIWRQFDALPLEARREVVDFIDFLQARYQKPHRKKKPQQTQLSGEPFIGIWKDREEMTDSTAWVRSARRNEWSG